MKRYLPPPPPAGRIALALLLFVCFAWTATAQHDLSLYRITSDVQVAQNDIVLLTYVLTNDLGTDVDGIEVEIVLPPGLDYVSHTVPESFDPLTGIWNVGSMAFFQPQRQLTLELRVVGEGVLTALAEVSAMNGTDEDSTPANGDLTEDDFVSSCVTVPIRAECGQSVKLEAPAGYGNYQWYKDGVAVVGAVGAAYNVGGSGSYTFRVGDLSATCVLGSCCPAIVTFDSISVDLSQPQLCTGGLDSVFVSVPEVDEVNFVQQYVWSSIDDPMLNFLSCGDCSEPSIVINGPYFMDSLRYVLSVVTRDLAGDIVCQANATVAIEVWQAPAITFDVPNYACAEDCVTLTVSTDLPVVDLTWDGPNLRSPDGLTMNYCPRTVTDHRVETFVVTAVGVDGCVRKDSVQIGTVPAIAVDITGDDLLCQFEFTTLTANVSPTLSTDSLSFVWSEDDGKLDPAAIVDGPSLNTLALAPDTYRFRVSVSRIAPDGSLLCAEEATFELTVQADCAQPRLGGFAWKDANDDGLRQNFEPPLEGTTVELFFADGMPTGRTATSDVTGFYEFDNLDVGDYFVEFLALPGFVFAPQNVGNDEFIDSDADVTGRSDVFPTTFDEAVHLVGVGYVGDCNLAVIDIVTTEADCGASDGSVSFNVFASSGSLTYTWLPDVSTTNAATDLPAGDYQVTIFDTYTLCELTETLTVPGSNNFILSVSSTPAACPMGKGGSITTFTDGGVAPFEVNYSGQETGTYTAASMPFNIPDLTGGTYAVSVTDASGCTQQDVIEVGENTLLLSIDTSNVVLASCNGLPDGAYDLEIRGFFGEYTMTINGLVSAVGATATTQEIRNRSAGLQEVVVVDANGCTQTFSFRLLDGSTPILLADLTVSDANCFGTATGAIAHVNGVPLEVRSSAGVLVGTLPQTQLLPGTYTLVDERNPACRSILDVTIGQPEELVLTTDILGSGCDVEDGAITLTLNGGTEPYGIVWADDAQAGRFRENLTHGDYPVRITDVQGCVIDTVLVVPNVCEPLVCAPFFTADTLLLTTTTGSLDWCMANFDVATNQRFEINGADATPSPCVRDGLVIYNMNSLPGAGTDGPYLIEFWFGGDDLVLAKFFNTPAELAVLMDEADSWGRWRFDASSNTIRGGQPGRPYGEIEITHVASGAKLFMIPEVLANQQSGSFVLESGFGYTITTTNTTTNCPDSIYVLVQQPDPCAELHAPGRTVQATPYCDQPAPVCLDLPFRLYEEVELVFDGVTYTGEAEPCAFANVVYYDIDGVDFAGGVYLRGWTVDGRFESARVASGPELAMRMRAFDGENWVYDPTQRVLRGGNTAFVYGNLSLETDAGVTTHTPEQDFPLGTRVFLLPSTYRAELRYAAAIGCVQTFSVQLSCSSTAPPNRDTVLWTLGVGFTDTLCLSTAELTGPIESIVELCPEQHGTFAAVVFGDTTCLVGTGIDIGMDTLCIRVCDVNGVCDTTIVLADVLDPIDFILPIAVRDVDSVDMNVSLDLDVLDNDTIRGALVSLEILTYPRNGNARVTDTGIRYTPDALFCGPDSLIYEMCNVNGCDTAIVDLTVVCQDLIIYSGFSPNFDDVNETFTVLGIQQFPDNRMEVYNRWGNRVFDMDNYDNSWDGTYYDGDDLPEGTYFYIFEDGRGKTYTGYVYLKR